jgi:hypothetical protein
MRVLDWLGLMVRLVYEWGLFIPAMSGLNHRHIVSTVLEQVAIRGIAKPTILDAGCGDGSLLALTAKTLPSVRSGFDSPDYGLQSRDWIGSKACMGVDGGGPAGEAKVEHKCE